MNISNLSKSLLLGLVGLGLSTTAIAGEKNPKTPKELHDYLMNRVVNKGTYDHATVKEDKENNGNNGNGNNGKGLIAGATTTANAGEIGNGGGDDNPTQSTEPMDKSILERLKVAPTITAETTDLLGEQIDLNSGSIGFRHTDISLPGNSSLDVAVRRVFKGLSRRGKQPGDFADWHLDIPNIQTTLNYWNGAYSGSWGMGQGCSGSLNPGFSYDMHNIYQDYQYWNGDTLNVPGHVNDKLLEPTTNLTTELGGNTSGIMRVTKSNWRIKCFTRGVPGSNSNADSFEGFTAYAPDGTKYIFDEPRLIAQPKANFKPRQDALKYQAYMLVSKIEDRFGNWVQYDYDNMSRLTRIHANDGREITLSYSEAAPFENNVSKVTANGREWTYSYSGSNANSRVLTTVTRPDNRSWSFNLANIGIQQPTAINDSCGYNNYHATSFSGSVTHPNGAVGNFVIKETQHGTSNIDPAQAMENAVRIIPLCSNHMSLQSKTLSGPGLPTLNWTYSYSQNGATTSLGGTMPGGINPLNHKTTTVIAPDGSRTKHYYDRNWTSLAQGMLAAKEQFDIDGTTLLSTTQNTFVAAEKVGRSLMHKTNVIPMDYRINQHQTITTLHHSDGNTVYTSENQSHNSLGNVLKSRQYNSATSAQKYVKSEYVNHISGDYYVLQLPTTTDQSPTDGSYVRLKESVYWPWDHSYKSQLQYEKRLGVWQTYNTYLADGNVGRIEYNATTDQGQNRYQTVANYHRGRAKTIIIPSSSGSAEHRVDLVVDNNGWLTTTKDFKNNSTSYSYDSMGRLTAVNPADSQWADTSISYATATAGEETGVVAGMFKQTLTKGGFSQTIYYDALLRPMLTKTTDGNTNVYQNTRYNAYNQETFKSYPSNSAANTSGSTTTFDGMQREKTISQTGASGSISYSYLAGHKRKLSNNRGKSTTTTYLAYGSPSYSKPTAIDAPESVYTAFSINDFGNVSQISQGGLIEYRYYDSAQRLCQTYRADTGKTVYHYNEIGEMQWYAEGASGVISGCSKADVPYSERVNLTYTNAGHIKTRDHADPATDDISYSYDANGNITSVNSGSTQWTYAYNSLNLPTAESLTVDGQTFNLSYGYDALGSLSTQTYPSGRQISYAPNAFGKPTKAGDFATNASYHANGTLTGFNYGNGLNYSLTLDNRLLPQTLKTSNGATTLTHLQYGYDANGNTSSITDHKDSSFNISMAYDNLDRLISANGKWGNNTSFSYDTMGNITSKSLGSMTVSYNYDATNKRLNSANVSGSKSKNYSFSYDSKGAVTNNGYTLLPRNQAGYVTQASGHTFVYDGNGKRVKDSKDGLSRYSVYNKAGQMIYQWDQRTETITDYIFLDGEMVSEAQVSLGNGAQSVDNTNVGYTGHQWDKDSGLNYMQSRYYDPLLGRFLSNDPIGYRDLNSFNRYVYANNNPYKFFDPDGEAPDFVHARRGKALIKLLAPKKYAKAIDKWTKGSKIAGLIESGKMEQAEKLLKETMSSRMRGTSRFKQEKKELKERGGKCEYCSENKASQVDHIDPIADFVDRVWDGLMTFMEAEEQVNNSSNYADACGGSTGSCNQSKGRKSLADWRGTKESKRVKRKRGKNTKKPSKKDKRKKRKKRYKGLN